MAGMASEEGALVVFNLTFQEWMTALQAVILFLGLGATFWTLRAQKIDSKNLATLNLIIHQRGDEQLNSATKTMNRLLDEKTEFADLSHYFDDPYSEECRAILKVLNFREFVAVGINQGIIDEKTYKQAFYTIVVNDWHNLEHTVKALRNCKKGKPTLFQDFELLAKRWEKSPLKQKVK